MSELTYPFSDNHPDVRDELMELYDEVNNPELWDIICLWFHSPSGVATVLGSGDEIPSLPDFEERFCGIYPTEYEAIEQMHTEAMERADITGDPAPTIDSIVCTPTPTGEVAAFRML